MIWCTEEFQQRIWQWNLRAALGWLALGSLAGFFAAAQHLWPAMIEHITFFPFGRLTFSTTNLLVFGGCFPLLFGAWFLRVRSLRRSTFAFFPLWEVAFWLWQMGVFVGTLFTLFGEFTIRPNLPWSPVAYGFLLCSALLHLGIFVANFPKTSWFRNSVSFWLFCAGLWTLSLGLLGFCSFSFTADIFSSAFLDLFLGLGLLLPILALLLPASRFQIATTETRALQIAFWAYLLAMPLAAPFFSGGALRVGLLIGAPFVLAAAIFVIALHLWSWSQHPQEYTAHLKHPQEMEHLQTLQLDENQPLQLPPWALSVNWRPAWFDQDHPWRNFLQAGIAGLLLLAFEGAVFSVLRVAGYHPSPTWIIARQLLWLATSAFWLQTALLIALGRQHTQEHNHTLRSQWRDGLLAVGFWTLGLWLETMLHVTLQDAGAPRDSLRPLLPRFLQLAGFFFAARALFAFFRIYRPYASLKTTPLALPSHLTPLLCLLCLPWLVACKQPEPKPLPVGLKTLGQAITAYSPVARNRTYWPTQQWQTKKPEEMGINAKALAAFDQYAFSRTGNDQDRKGIRTDGVVIIKGGYLVFEKYARGFDKDRPHLAWSVSKSFVNALYGIAKQQGLLSLDQPASALYKPLDRGQHKNITIRHLLQMTPGLFWREGYEASFFDSSVLAMLYSEGRKDMGAFAAQQPMRYQPGTHWYYSSGTSNLAVAVLRSALKGQDMDTWMWTHLFDRIGMKNVTWQRDGSNNVVGSSYLYASPRQLAKFGYLYLNDGLWENKRLLPEGWVAFTATVPPADEKGEYGAHWWLNVGRPENKVPPRFPKAPRDMLRASGHWGQRIYAFPSHDLVVVLTSDNRDDTFKEQRFLELLFDAVQTKLPPSPSGKPDLEARQTPPTPDPNNPPSKTPPQVPLQPASQRP
jgi:CubicO group peptidase (beta-lactamase class C family)